MKEQLIWKIYIRILSTDYKIKQGKTNEDEPLRIEYILPVRIISLSLRWKTIKNSQEQMRQLLRVCFERIRESFSQILKAGVHRLCSRNPDYISDQKKRFFSTEFQSKTNMPLLAQLQQILKVERETFSREEANAHRQDSQKDFSIPEFSLDRE